MEPSFWHERWAEGRIGFHRDDVNDALDRWWGAIECSSDQSVLVPLCGKSVDLWWLREKGHSVFGVELSPIAVQQFWSESNREPNKTSTERFDVTTADGVTMLCGDLFDLTQQDINGIGAVYDRASIIALRPDLRVRYCEHLASLLQSGTRGLMLTLSYDQSKLDGPPFSIDPDLLRDLLGEDFAIECLHTEDLEIENPRMQDADLPSLQRHVFQLIRR